ncbi:MAG: LysR family transcriptional regulator [Deltaproteobacteria bacterium]|nr:LysR family transcriptional regulator [Deltaproteobacteria bacterium]
MESLYLRTLIEVVRTGSFSRAAENLRVTQSAVSRRVKYMEDHYKYALLDRSGPVLTATPAGQLVLDKAAKILDLERELLSGLELLEQKTRLSVACTPTFAFCHLPRVLRSFVTRADLVELRVTLESPESLLEGLRQGLYDIAVADHCDFLDVSEFVLQPLPSDEMVFVSPSDSRIPPYLEDVALLLQKTFITRKEGCCSRTLLESNLSRAGRAVTEFSRTLVLDDLRLVIEAVRSGAGIAFVSTEVVAGDVAAGALQEHRVRGFQHQRCRSLILTPEAQGDPMVHDFQELVLSYFAGRQSSPSATAAPKGPCGTSTCDA